jgi:membrane protease YdiL (CAAX protease family)
MNPEVTAPLSFWRTVWLLLTCARARADRRTERQRQLLSRRKGGGSDWGRLGFFITVLVMAALNSAAAFLIRTAVESGERAQAECEGKIVVSDGFLAAAKARTLDGRGIQDVSYRSEAYRIAEASGGSGEAIEERLRAEINANGTVNLVPESDAAPGLDAPAARKGLAAFWGSLMLACWGLMLVFQGDGLEMDVTRQRHPMWEWLFSHPVPPGAVFLAEMLSPIAANPVYWGAPLCIGFLYSFVYDPFIGILATFAVGVPAAIATACMGKALEVAVTLRSSVRARGALIGLMSWLGYVLLMLTFFGLLFLPKLIAWTTHYFTAFSGFRWPLLDMVLGARPDGSFSFILGVLTSWILIGAMGFASVQFSVWGAQRGLVGFQGGKDTAPTVSSATPTFGKDPLYRKEFLWFIRDRSAIVQTILIPLTVAAFQLVNLRGILNKAQSEWSYLCGAAILFGTYFLWILGPRSLASEGAALWIALTWPRGLESLLKAKAWLWSLISTALVALVLCYTIVRFPTDSGPILLVGFGWFYFARSMAEKTVTLVSVPDSSGETQPVHWGRKWAAQLGMLTFAIGVLTKQWTLALNGIIYSHLTAAAMWQNFRARLPYLFDPWSEENPPAPTLMHAMIGISVLVECGAILTGIVVAAGGREYLGSAMAIGYGLSAVIVGIGMSMFLSGRDVAVSDIWTWSAAHSDDTRPQPSIVHSIGWGVLGGIAIASIAYLYGALLRFIPALQELIRHSQLEMAGIPGFRFFYALIAIGFAPFAEEYLFRGLLYRALDREWGGWRAVLGSAAFFAIYHPPLSWLPVGLLGIATAVLFKKTGRLLPAIAVHMVYNAIVILLW